MRFVNYKILIGIGVIIVLVSFITNTSQKLIQVQHDDSIVSELESELERKTRQNNFLQEQLKYVQTDDFVEKQSREKLGLVKEGEVVVQERFDHNINSTIEQSLSKPNWRQWLELFI